MKKIPNPVDALSEATKEALRMFVIGAFSFIVTNILDFAITYFANVKVSDLTGQIMFAGLLYLLKALDKYWHERQKQTGESNVLTKTSGLLEFNAIKL
jgi:hypothetical protein